MYSLLFLPFILCACGKDIAQTGNVDEKLRPLRVVYYNEDEKPIIWYTNEYDDAGLLIRQQVRDSTDMGKRSWAKEYTYRDTFVTQITTKFPNGDITERVVIEYEDNMKMKETSYDDLNQEYSVIRYEFNKSGKVTKESISFGSHGGYYIEFSYDADNNMTGAKKVDSENGLVQKDSLIYRNGRFAEYFRFLPSRNVAGKFDTLHLSHEYDEAGHLIKTREYGKDGNTYIYSERGYDKDGNLIIEESFREDKHKLLYAYSKENGKLSREEYFDRYGRIQRVTFYQ